MDATNPQAQAEFLSLIDISAAQIKTLEQILGKPPTTGDLLFLSHLKRTSSKITAFSPIIAHAIKPSNKIIRIDGDPYYNLGGNVLLSLAVVTSDRSYPFFPYQNNVSLFHKSYHQLIAKKLQPIASINSLRMGNINREAVQDVFDKSVAAISDCSNFGGIPVLGSELYFDDSFNQSGLSNILTLGIGQQAQVESTAQLKAGDIVLYLSKESMQQDFSEAAYASPDNAAFVALPDHLYLQNILAFYQACQEKEIPTLFASCLRIGRDVALFNLIDGIPLGLEVVWPDAPPSGSIEEELKIKADDGFLIGIPAHQVEEIQALALQYGTHYTQVGQFINEERLIIRGAEEIMVDLPKRAIDQEALAATHFKNPKKPSYIDKSNKFSFKRVKHQKDYGKHGLKLFQSPNIIAKRRPLSFYNSIEGIENLSYNVPSDVAVFQVPEIGETLALTVTGNPRYIKSDPYLGTMMAISEAARGIINSGGKPLAFSIGLNFGDVDQSGVQWQLQQCLRGVAEAAKKFRLTLVEVETSFGHENIHNKGSRPILPSPVIGMVGSLDRPKDIVGIGFKETGDLIYMIGTPHNDFNASTYLSVSYNNPSTPGPIFDLDEEYHIMVNIRKLIQKDLLVSAHKITEGGLFKALLDCADVDNYGFTIETDTNFRKDAYLFGESQGRSIVTTKPDREDELVNFLNAQNVPFSRLGEVRGDEIIIDEESLGSLKEWDASEFRALVD
ncbi:MAG: AIR synthase related protein [Bacteroidota bacterium]